MTMFWYWKAGFDIRRLKSGLKYIVLIAGIGLLMNCRNTREVTFEELHSPQYLAVDTILELYMTKYRHFLNTHSDTTKFPRCYAKGKVNVVESGDWTSGFFPGILWLLYEYSGDEEMLNAASSWTNSLKENMFNTSTHDVGFIIHYSFGHGYRLTKNKDYLEVLDTAARSLASRFSRKVGCIKSLDDLAEFKYPVLIDNLVNLEILYSAWRRNDNIIYYQIANDHALQTMEMQYRPDFSAFQMVDYDPATGLPRYKGSFQGFSDSTSWGRGQAWGLYGFVLAFQYTNDRVFLDQSLRIANYIIHHPQFPTDFIPYWDFEDPGIPEVLRDATTAVIMASSFLDLSTYEEVQDRLKFRIMAEKIIHNLVKEGYLAGTDENANFVLKHGVGNKPGGTEVDVPLIYGDYYLLEALLKYKNILNHDS